MDVKQTISHLINNREKFNEIKEFSPFPGMK